MKKPLILVTNDDGIDSKGIRLLVSIMSKFGEVVVVFGKGWGDTNWNKMAALVSCCDYGVNRGAL